MGKLLRRTLSLVSLVSLLAAIPMTGYLQVFTDDAFSVFLPSQNTTLQVFKTNGSFSEISTADNSVTVTVPLGQTLTIVSPSGYELSNNAGARTECTSNGATLYITTSVPATRIITITPGTTNICTAGGGGSGGGGGGSAGGGAAGGTTNPVTTPPQVDYSAYKFTDVNLTQKTVLSLARKNTIYRFLEEMYKNEVYLYPSSKLFKPDNVTDYYFAIQLALTVKGKDCIVDPTFTACVRAAREAGIISAIPANRRVTRGELYDMLYKASGLSLPAKIPDVTKVCTDISAADAEKDSIKFFAAKKSILYSGKNQCSLTKSLPRHLALALASKVAWYKKQAANK